VAQRALRQLGFSIPRDVSVVGYGNSLPVALADPPLTTVAQPFNEMGRLAIRHIIETHQQTHPKTNGANLNGADEKTFDLSTQVGSTCVLPTKLIVRESTATATLSHSPR
jgi:DNA-binding LacI/PurR family transcriptional regulator